MPNSEIELKFRVTDPNVLQANLPALGFHLETARTFEHNTLYDTPGRDLRAKRQILRLRRYGHNFVLTHKRMPDNADDTRYKTRIETETLIGDCPAMAEIFHQLGYSPVFIYEKFRTEWSQPVPGSDKLAHLVIDETPIGTWAELEGPVRWIDQTLQSLAIDRADCLTDSYGTLFNKWREETGSPIENLTFEDIAPALAAR